MKRVAIATSLVCLAGLGSTGAAAAEVPTFNKDISPILWAQLRGLSSRG